MARGAGKPEDPLLVEDPAWVKTRASGDTRIRTNTRRIRITRACLRAGVPVFPPHGLRRLVDDLLYETGADPGVTAKTLGQSPVVALKSYRRVRPDKQHRAMLRAGLDAVLREPGDKVIHLPGAKAPPEIDLSSVSSELLEAELLARGWVCIERPERVAVEGGGA